MAQRKGQTGNPKGKPKGATNLISRPLRERMAQALERSMNDWETIWKDLKPFERVQAIRILADFTIAKPTAEPPKGEEANKTYTVNFA